MRRKTVTIRIMKKNQFINYKQHKLLLGGAMVIWLLLCMVFTPIYTTVTLELAEDPSGEYITTIYAGPREKISVPPMPKAASLTAEPPVFPFWMSVTEGTVP